MPQRELVARGDGRHGLGVVSPGRLWEATGYHEQMGSFGASAETSSDRSRSLRGGAVGTRAYPWHVSRPSHRDRPLPERIAAVWRDPAGGTRTRPVFVASLCAGVIGFTLARALHLNERIVAYVLTVIVVFAVTTAVLVWRDTGS